jgi:DTW domain-containing protein YfiP
MPHLLFVLARGTAILVTSSPMQQCTGCEKSQTNCFWYQTPSNLIKMRIILVFSLSTETTKLVASIVLPTQRYTNRGCIEAFG